MIATANEVKVVNITVAAEIRKISDTEFEADVLLHGDTGKPQPIRVLRRGGSAGQALSIAVSWAFDYVNT